MSLGKSTRHLFHKAVRNIFMSGGLGTLEKLCVFYFVRPKITVVMTILKLSCLKKWGLRSSGGNL